MQTKTLKECRPYALLVLMGLLVMLSGLFLRAGAEGATLWVIAAAICATLLVRAAAYLRLERRDGELAKLLAASFVVVLLVGEFGASTDSRLSFAVSIWRVGMLVFLCIVLREESMEGHPVLQKLAGSSLGALFWGLLAVMGVTVLAQWFFAGNDNVKGIVRFVTYYGALAASLYCALAIVRPERVWAALQTAFRVALIVLLGLAIVEMLTGFHLPTSWLSSDSASAQAKLAAIGNPALYITATGPCYNPNNFCLLLATLASLSIPTTSEPARRKRLGVVLFYGTLVIVAMLGSTIVSLGMISSAVGWCVATRTPVLTSFARIVLALLCVFVIADGCLDAAGRLVSDRAQEAGAAAATAAPGSAETVTGDFSVQLKNYEGGGGSMWMRVTLYREEIAAIADNPLGVGPGNVQSYFEENPSKSKLVDPHNWLLEFAMSYGVFSAAIYLGLLLALLLKLGKLARDGTSPYAAPLLAGLLAAGVGSFAPSSSDFNTLLWIPVVFGAALVIQVESPSNKARVVSWQEHGTSGEAGL